MSKNKMTQKHNFHSLNTAKHQQNCQYNPKNWILIFNTILLNIFFNYLEFCNYNIYYIYRQSVFTDTDLEHELFIFKETDLSFCVSVEAVFLKFQQVEIKTNKPIVIFGIYTFGQILLSDIMVNRRKQFNVPYTYFFNINFGVMQSTSQKDTDRFEKIYI